MAKRVKMVLHAEPGVGKSTFAGKAPNPFFITTDGNYEWLGLPDEDHIQVFSWEEMKKVFARIAAKEEVFDKYDTIVVDLLEDGFKWNEMEYCKRNKIQHMSDLPFGKAYDETRNEFYIEVSKLLGVDKHIILLTHGVSKVEKDRRGVETTKYIPSPRIPDKVWDMIEGRVRYFLRAYVKGEEIDGKMVKKRYLSIIPKENEFGIARGLDESNTPEDIPLEWSVFAATIGLDDVELPAEKPVKVVKPVVKPTPVVKPEPKVEPKPEIKKVETTVVEEPKEDPETIIVSAQPVPEEVHEVVEEPVKEVKVEPVAKPASAPATPKTQEQKLAEIAAKLKAMKAAK